MTQEAVSSPAQVPAVRNPFGQREVATVATARSDEQRAITEVQAALVVARANPRNERQAMDRILVACQRPGLAEAAVFSYSRGGQEITGPSIRLAEAVAQVWGNVQFGVRELDQHGGASTVQAYAWDVETNVRREVTFVVQHERHTKKGVTSLSDPRDIYETVANAGARRLRACILALIPGDVVEAAVRQCEATLDADADNGPEAVGKMVASFAAMGVTTAQLEARILRRLDTITKAQVVALRKVFVSLRDGMSSVEDWFPVERQAEQAKAAAHAPLESRVEESQGLGPAKPATAAAPVSKPKAAPKAKAEPKAEVKPKAEPAPAPAAAAPAPQPAAAPVDPDAIVLTQETDVHFEFAPPAEPKQGALLWQGPEFGFMVYRGSSWVAVPEAEADVVYSFAHARMQFLVTRAMQAAKMNRDGAMQFAKDKLGLDAPPARLADLRCDQLNDLAKALGTT